MSPETTQAKDRLQKLHAIFRRAPVFFSLPLRLRFSRNTIEPAKCP